MEFVHCPIAYRIWGFFLSRLAIAWSFPSQFQDLILGWGVKDLDGFPYIIWQALPSAICWSLWKERNTKIFYGRMRNQIELVNYIYNLLFDWVSIRAEFEEMEWFSFWSEDNVILFRFSCWFSFLSLFCLLSPSW